MQTIRHLPVPAGTPQDVASAERAFQSIADRGYGDTVEELDAASSADVHRAQAGVDARPTELGHKAAEGAGIGGAIGGGLGAIAAAIAAVGSTIALPGLGLVIAGPLAAAIAGAGAGAAIGGIVGALVGWGIPEERVRVADEATLRLSESG